MDFRVLLISLPLFLGSSATIYFLAKRGSVQMHPLLLNGSRLCLAGVTLLGFSWMFGVRFEISMMALLKYAGVAALAIAIPQGMLFVALRSSRVTETAAAFIEGCVPAITFIFLFAVRPISNPWITLGCITLALLGLALFLGVTFQARLKLDRSLKLVILSAVVTSLGLVATDFWLPNTGITLAEKMAASVWVTAMTTLMAGVSTMLYALLVLKVRWKTPSRLACRYVIALALLGSGFCWISLFLLIREDVVVAASALIAVPVVVAAINWVLFKRRMNRREIGGAALINLALLALILVKLA